jgi:DNA-binding response OmpR family regulator
LFPAAAKTLLRAARLTGYGQAEDRKAVKDAGFDAYLVKPLKPEELAQIRALYPNSRLGAK